MSGNVPLVLADYLSKHYGSLKVRLARLLRNSDLADDALHDTWLRVNSKKKEPDVILRPASYLLRVAVNIAVDIRRRQSRAVSYDDIAELIDAADSMPGPEQIVAGRLRVEALTKHIDRLPRRQRLVVVLVYWDGLEQKDVAKRLGVSLRTVESDLRKAHNFLNAQTHG